MNSDEIIEQAIVNLQIPRENLYHVDIAWYTIAKETLRLQEIQHKDYLRQLREKLYKIRTCWHIHESEKHRKHMQHELIKIQKELDEVLDD